MYRAAPRVDQILRALEAGCLSLAQLAEATGVPADLLRAPVSRTCRQGIVEKLGPLRKRVYRLKTRPVIDSRPELTPAPFAVGYRTAVHKVYACGRGFSIRTGSILFRSVG